MTVMKMMFSTSQTNPNGQLHIGDLVSDIYNATKCGVVVGLLEHKGEMMGAKVSWWLESDLVVPVESEEVTGSAFSGVVNPLQLILLIKAVQC